MAAVVPDSFDLQGKAGFFTIDKTRKFHAQKEENWGQRIINLYFAAAENFLE